MYYLTDFKHFVSIFSWIFNLIGPTFSLILIFLTPHFHKTLDLIWSNFFQVLNPASEHLMKYPAPPPPRGWYYMDKYWKIYRLVNFPEALLPLTLWGLGTWNFTSPRDWTLFRDFFFFLNQSFICHGSQFSSLFPILQEHMFHWPQCNKNICTTKFMML